MVENGLCRELQNGLTSCPSKSVKRNWTDCKSTKIETILCGKNYFIQRILMNHFFVPFLEALYCCSNHIYSQESPLLLWTFIIWHSFHQLKWGRSTKLRYHLGKKIYYSWFDDIHVSKRNYTERKRNRFLFIAESCNFRVHSNS